jgi:uncharacterized membrane protein
VFAHGVAFPGPDWVLLATLFFAPFVVIGVPLSLFMLLGAAIELLGYRRLTSKTRAMVRAVCILGVFMTVVGCVVGIGCVFSNPKDYTAWVMATPGAVLVGLSKFCLWRDSKQGPFF